MYAQKQDSSGLYGRHRAWDLYTKNPMGPSPRLWNWPNGAPKILKFAMYFFGGILENGLFGTHENAYSEGPGPLTK